MSVSSLTGYLATSKNLTATSISTTGSIITTDGNVVIEDPNSGAVTYNTDGLTLSRNISNGQDEYDIIAVNKLTEDSLNIYTSNVSVVGGTTLPTLALASTGNITASRGSITAQTGFTATTGNIVATDGNIVATDGDITANAGTITGENLVSNDNIVAENNITATAGDITATAGNITAAGDITATAGGIYSGDGFTANGGGITLLNAGDAGPTGVYNANHTLNITQNLSNSQNEIDFIVINSTSSGCVNFYYGDGTTAVTNATIPILRIVSNGIRPTAIIDTNDSFGSNGQYLVAQGDGTFLWTTP
jgi:hypothetical protein